MYQKEAPWSSAQTELLMLNAYKVSCQTSKPFYKQQYMESYWCDSPFQTGMPDFILS